MPVLTVDNKIDLTDEDPRIEYIEKNSVIYLSAKTGSGVALLRKKLLDIAGWQFNNAGEGLFMARQRHLHALSNAKKHLEYALTYTQDEYQLELLAEELRLAQDALSAITGKFTADDLLGEIFSHFCIGK